MRACRVVVAARTFICASADSNTGSYQCACVSMFTCRTRTIENPISTPDIFTAGSQRWIAGKALKAFFQFIEIAAGLCLAPLSDGVLPDANQIAFREWAEKDSLHQRLDRCRAFALIFFMSSSVASPLLSPSINV